MSLRLRLILAGVPALLLALALVGLAVDRAFRESAMIAVQERLESTMHVALGGIELDEDGSPQLIGTLADSRLEQPGSGIYAGIIGQSRTWESNSLLGEPAVPEVTRIAQGQSQFLVPAESGGWFLSVMGVGWEVPSGRILHWTVWAAEDPRFYNESVSGFRRGLWRWLGVAAVLVIVAQLLVMRFAFQPLRKVADDVGAIESGRRDQLGGRYPSELQPLTSNLNALLTTERANAQRYERALGDLAHALKSPLAVMRARLESEGDDSKLLDGVGDMERMVRHKLDEAAHSTRRTMHRPVPAGPVLERLRRGLSKIYGPRGVGFEINVEDAPAALMGERELMEIAGNLLDNAAKYGGGKVRASVRPGAPGARHPGMELIVEDNGPGVDPELFPALLQRGVRGDERGDGHGLGLAIVANIVEAHAGSVSLDKSDLGGAAIRVILPPR